MARSRSRREPQPARRRPEPASARRRPPGGSARSGGGRDGEARRSGSDLGARILYAVPLIALAIFLVIKGGTIFAIGALVLGLLCMHELYGMLASFRPVKLAGFLSLAGLVVAARFGTPFQIVLAATASLALIVLLILAGPVRAGATVAIAATLLGVVWIGLPIAHAVLLRDLPHGDGIVVDILVGTFIGDTAAYLGGRAFGTRRLAPTISPNKTVEGWVIGMVMAIAGVWFAGLYQDWLSGTDALFIGLGVAVFAPLGDLFASLVKRDVGVKDTGTVFGPHGGALDRLDAVLFTLPVGFYIWSALL
jgi:phosphatidate cytidylyltransferase